MHGFLPTGFFEHYINKGQWYAVPLAVLIGVPMYSNAAGVIPIIFAVSFVLLPQLVGNFLANVKNPSLSGIGHFLTTFFSPAGFFYNFFYFILVIVGIT